MLYTHGPSARRIALRTIATISIVAVAIAGATALAADATTTGTIEWKSGPETTQPQDVATMTATLDATLRSNARHVVVQFNQPITPALRQQLANAGVQVLNYLGDNSFFAAVDQSRTPAANLAQFDTLRAILPIQRDWKLHSSFATGQFPEWAVFTPSKTAGEPDKMQATKELKSAPDHNAQTVAAAYVLFHPDVPAASTGVQICRAHGAWVRSVLESINGLVVELPAADITALADEDAVQWIEPPLPRLSMNNNSNRARVGADTVAQPPYSLDGSGVTVLVYDGGTAYAGHADFGGRCTVRDTSGTHYHSTHVAGTVGGDGSASGGTYRGMAPGVTIESYGFEQEGGLHEGFLYTDPGDIEDDYSEAITTYGADIANNSIGTNTAPNGFDCEWEGNYGATGVLIDTIVRGDGTNPLFAAPFRIVWANGNERGSGRCGTTYHTTAPPACAKNHITVGALNSNDDSVTSFTSWGPTDDGRLKPDISAPGCQSDDDEGVTSCDTDGGYLSICGTSMASPTVCGLGALLIQDYRQQYPGEPDFRNSTLKTLLAHTAADQVTAEDNLGPDYIYGYGSVRIQPAVDLLRSGNFIENQVDQGDTYSVIVIVSPGDAEMRATLAWDDVPGTPNVNPVLVNDLDLRVFDATNNQYFPWTLDPSDPGAPAARTQADHLNNIEQVVIDSPAPGAYRVEVYGHNVSTGPQPFSLAATPYLVNCSSQGTIALDRSKYPCQAQATVRVVDCDLNTDDGVIETVTITLISDSEPTGESLLLTETAPEAAAFVGTITLATTDDTGVLLIAPGDTVTATYIDEDDGQGGTNITVQDTAAVDCTPPVISNIQVAELNPRDATITCDTDESALAQIRYGLSCGALTLTQQGSGFRTNHSIRLTGLTDNTSYYYVIDVEDEAGNATTDDNGGNCYVFTTPEVPDYFTEEFGSNDNDLDNLSLFFIPNGSYDGYAGCAEPITTLPTDPAGGTTISLSDDDNEQVTLTGGAAVALYGQSYTSFYVSSNGYITFTSGDSDYSESLSDHFDLPRISALFDDLNPSSGGTVSYRQLVDRVAVTWQNVPEYSNTGANTFQIELYFDGQITVSFLNIDATDGLAGLSAGLGLSPDYFETDLSAMGACGPRPPSASNAEAATFDPSPITIELLGEDDGLPDPPAALSTVIDVLPTFELVDPGNGHIITADDLPYTLVNGGNQVVYRRFQLQPAVDSFRFHADDGGTPPEGGPSNIATVTITIGGIQPVYAFPLDDDPGWTTEGQWAFGQPTGGGSHNGDPTSGYTGLNVYGYNLAGDYTDNMPLYALTTTALDCSALVDTELRFWRWLGVESATFDHATLEISTDGTTWSDIWTHSGYALSESAWSYQLYDIAGAADGQPAVFLRWTMGTTDSSVTYPGWNIDDIELWALTPARLGDLNCDSSIDFDDINPFVLALSGPDAYYAQYPDCNHWTADMDGNGAVDFDDINPFVDALGGGK